MDEPFVLLDGVDNIRQPIVRKARNKPHAAGREFIRDSRTGAMSCDWHFARRRRNFSLKKGKMPVTTHSAGTRIANELASCGVRLVASLPDNWLTDVIDAVKQDERFIHIPVHREESAIALCSGAYMGALGSAALLGASGLMTVIYAITKINYTYEIPIFLLATLRGAAGDHHKHHVANGLYLLRVLDAINMPYAIIDKPYEISLISRFYRQTRTVS